MNGLFGNYNSLMQIQPWQTQGINRAYGGMNIQIPQQDLSSYYNKPMMSQEDYQDYLHSSKSPMSKIMSIFLRAFNRPHQSATEQTTS